MDSKLASHSKRFNLDKTCHQHDASTEVDDFEMQERSSSEISTPSQTASLLVPGPLLQVILSFFCKHLHLRLLNKDWNYEICQFHARGGCQTCYALCTCSQFLARRQRLPWITKWQIASVSAQQQQISAETVELFGNYHEIHDFHMHTPITEIELICHDDNIYPGPPLASFEQLCSIASSSTAFSEVTALSIDLQSYPNVDKCLHILLSETSALKKLTELKIRSYRMQSKDISFLAKNSSLSNLTKFCVHSTSERNVRYLDIKPLFDSTSAMAKLQKFSCNAGTISPDIIALCSSPNATQLKELELGYCLPSLSVAAFEALATSPCLHNLISLNMSGCILSLSEISNYSTKNLANFTRLTSLVAFDALFSKMRGPTTEQQKPLLPNLQGLTLVLGSLVNGTTIDEYSSSFATSYLTTNLSQLTLYRDDHTWSKLLSICESECPSALQELSFINPEEWSPSTSSSLQKLADEDKVSFPFLHRLKGTGCKLINSKAFEAFASLNMLQELTTLDLHNSTDVDNSCLKIILQNCLHLRILDLNRTSVDEAGVEMIAVSKHMGQLRYLDLSFCGFKNAPNIVQISQSANMGNIRFLGLCNCKLDSHELWTFSQGTMLKNLLALKLTHNNLECNLNLHECCANFARNFPRLTDIDISHNTLKDEGLQVLMASPLLENQLLSLDLRENQVSESCKNAAASSPVVVKNLFHLKM